MQHFANVSGAFSETILLGNSCNEKGNGFHHFVNVFKQTLDRMRLTSERGVKNIAFKRLPRRPYNHHLLRP